MEGKWYKAHEINKDYWFAPYIPIFNNQDTNLLLSHIPIPDSYYPNQRKLHAVWRNNSNTNTTEGQRQMRNLKLNFTKETILSHLKRNQEQHKKHYQRAIELWREKLLSELEKTTEPEYLDTITKLPDELLSINDKRPYDYSKQYEKAIKMLELSTGDKNTEITLSHEEVSTLIHDEWEFKRHIKSNLYFAETNL